MMVDVRGIGSNSCKTHQRDEIELEELILG